MARSLAFAIHNACADEPDLGQGLVLVAFTQKSQSDQWLMAKRSDPTAKAVTRLEALHFLGGRAALDVWLTGRGLKAKRHHKGLKTDGPMHAGDSRCSDEYSGIDIE